jgi:hypothetical protein
MFQTLVCTLPKCLCAVPTDTDCLTATATLCAGQDVTVTCVASSIVQTSYTPCVPPGTVCYEELIVAAGTPICAAPPVCTGPGTFAYGTGTFRSNKLMAYPAYHLNLHNMQPCVHLDFILHK